MRNAKLEHTLSYGAAPANMRILAPNRYTGNRTVGSNGTLSADLILFLLRFLPRF